MSICVSDLDEPFKRCKITLEVSETHALIKLASTIDWRHLAEIVLPDFCAMLGFNLAQMMRCLSP